MVHNPIILSYRMPPTIFCNTTIFSLGLLLEFEVNLGTLKMIKKSSQFSRTANISNIYFASEKIV